MSRAKPILIGTYRLGFENVRLFADRGSSGAYVVLAPNDKQTAMIVVEMERPDFDGVVGCLMHELVEVTLHRQRNAWMKTLDNGNDSLSGFLFVMTHEEMNSMTKAVAPFLCECMEDFKKAWKQINKVK